MAWVFVDSGQRRHVMSAFSSLYSFLGNRRYFIKSDKNEYKRFKILRLTMFLPHIFNITFCFSGVINTFHISFRKGSNVLGRAEVKSFALNHCSGRLGCYCLQPVQYLDIHAVGSNLNHVSVETSIYS